MIIKLIKYQSNETKNLFWWWIDGREVLQLINSSGTINMLIPKQDNEDEIFAAIEEECKKLNKEGKI